MNIFSIDLDPNEIQFLRQALDRVSIKGTDAKFVANLQIKLETELIQIQEIIKQEENILQPSKRVDCWIVNKNL